MTMFIRKTNHPYTAFVNDLLQDKRSRLGQMNEFENTQTFGLALDVDENENAYTIFANLPGVSLDEINVSIHDDVLTISADVATTEHDENTHVLIRERRAGKFSRSLRFPVPVNGDGIEASFDNGVLHIVVPKAEEAKPRQIPVTVASGNS